MDGRRQGNTLPGDQLQVALAAMPAERKAVLSLHYLEGFSTIEIAGILDIPQGTVKSRLHHARSKLRELIDRS